MNIAFTFKNFEASDHLKKYARRRMEKMGRFFGKASGLEVGVVLTVDKFRHRCEVTIAGEGLHLSASEQSSDMYAAIDLAADRVSRQLCVTVHLLRHRKRGNCRRRSKDGNQRNQLDIAEAEQDAVGKAKPDPNSGEQ